MPTKTPVKPKTVTNTPRAIALGVLVVIGTVLRVVLGLVVAALLFVLGRLTGVTRGIYRHARANARGALLLTLVSLSLGTALATTLTTTKPTATYAATTSTLNFQARLMNTAGAIVPDGNYNVEFKLYNSSSSSGSSQGSCTGDANCQWTETYTGANVLQVKNGYLTVNLGSLTAFPTTINWDQQEWLTMRIGGTGAPSWDPEMNPKLALTAIPYAFRAGQLAQYNSTTGYTSTLSLLQPTGGNQTFQVADQGAAGTYTLLTSNAANLNYIQNTITTQASSNFNISGNGTIGGTLSVTGAITSGLVNSQTISSAANLTGTLVVATSVTAPLFDSTGTTALNVGTGANAKIVTLGNGTGATQVIVNAGTAGINLGNNGVNKTINVGVTGATANTTALNLATSTGATQTVNIGGTGASSGSNAGSTVVLQGGASMLKVANAGATVQTFTNSTTGFQVQNASATPIFIIDTTTTNLITNPGFEVNTTGWAGSGTGVTATQNLTLAKAYFGYSSLKVVTASSGTTTATVNGFTASLTAGTYNFSFYAMGDSAITLGSTVTFTGGAGTCTLNSTSVVTTGFNRYSCSITTTGTTTGISFTTTTTSANLYIDSVQLTTTTNLVPYRIGGIELRGVVTSPTAFQATSNSTSAFQIQNAAGTGNLFIADTINGRIGIGTAAPGYALDVNGDINLASGAALRFGGTSVCTVSGCTAGGSITNTKPSAGTAQSANFYIKSADTAANATAAIRQATSQTGDLLQFQDSSGTTITRFDSVGSLFLNNGNVLVVGQDSPAQTNVRTTLASFYPDNIALVVKGVTSQTGDLQEFQDLNGTILTSINATGALNLNGASSTNLNLNQGGINTAFGGFGRSQNLLLYSEQLDNASWPTANVTVVANNASAPDGTSTAETITTTNTSNSIGEAATVTPSTTYTFSWWAKLGSLTAPTYAVFDITHSSYITLSTAYNANTTGWQRFSATFTTPAGATSIGVYPEAGDTTNGTMYIWGAQLEQASTAGTYIQTAATAAGTSSTGLVVDGNQVIQDKNGAVGLTIQESASQTNDIFQALDSTGAILSKIDVYGNLYTNTLKTTSNLTRIQLNSNGSTSGNVNIGTQGSTNIGLVVQGAVSQSADLLQLQNSSGAVLAKVDASGSINGQTIVAANGLTSLQSNTYNTSLYIANIANSVAPVAIFKLGATPGVGADALQIQNSSGNTLTKFNSNGDLQIGGANSAASTTAFQIQNASSVSLLSADTSSMVININNPTATTGSTVTTGTDSFNTGGPALPAQWTLYRGAGDTTSSTSYNSAAVGKLRISPKTTVADDCWQGTMTCVRVLETSPTADFTVETKIDTNTSSTHGAAQGIFITTDATCTSNCTFLRMEKSENGGSGYNINVYGNTAGAADNSGTGSWAQSSYYGDSAPVYLRVVHTSNLWTVSYSFNGTTWTALTSFTKAMTMTGANAKIGPYFDDGSADSGYTAADFDYFNVSYNTSIYATALNVNGDVSLTNGRIIIGGNTICDSTGCVNGTGGGTAANTTLSNLSGPTAINTDLTFASGSTRNINVAQSTSGGGSNLALQAGAAQASGNANGGNLVLSGGAGYGTGLAGSVIVQSATNTSTEFQVQNAAGVGVLTADSTQQRIIIGPTANGTAAGQLYVGGSIPSSYVSSFALTKASPATNYTNTRDVATQGSYVYITSATTLLIYNIATPASPVQTATYAVPGATTIYKVVVVGKYAYLTDIGNNKIFIVNISNPYSPSVVSSVSPTFNGGATPQGLAISGRYMYVSMSTGTYLDVIDIANPANPVVIGTYTGGVASGATTAGSGTNNEAVDMLSVQGKYVYTANMSDDTLRIFDISTPSSPSQVSSTHVSAGTGAYDNIAVRGNYVYAEDNSGVFSIQDVTNPAIPVRAGYGSTGSGGANSIVLQGRYAYIAEYFQHYAVYDISNPNVMPTYVGSMPFGASSTNTQAMRLNGRYAYGIDDGAGGVGHLTVYDLGGTYTQSFEAGSLTSTSGSFDGALSVGGNTSLGGLNVDGAAQLNGDLSVNGNATISSAANSTTAFQVQNATGAAVLLVDTTSSTADGTIVNYLTYPGFEAGTTGGTPTGWTGNTTTVTLNAVKGNTFNGLYSALVTTSSATAGAGITTTSFNSAPPVGNYLVSFYVKSVSGVALTSGLFQITGIDGSTHSTTCTAGTAITATGFTRVTCSFTVATSALTSLKISQTDASTRSYYIDAVQLQSTTYNGGVIVVPTAYQIGEIMLRGVITNPVAIFNNTDSTAAFQVGNAASSNVLVNVDTLNSTISLAGSKLTSTAFIFGGTGSISSGGATNLSIGLGGAGTLNIATSTSYVENVNIATGNQTHTINIANSAGAVQQIVVGNNTATSRITLNGGNISTTNGANGIIIGSGFSTSDTNLVPLTLDSTVTYGETAGTCSATVNGGSLYYNYTTNAIRTCIRDAANAGGNWEDVVTTAGLGIIMFGVVPDSGTAASQGDLSSVTGSTVGPCKVSVGATLSTVSWTSCVAYSGGRKVSVAAGTAATTNSTAFQTQHLCLTNSGQPALTAAGSETTFTGIVFSPNNPILCIADIGMVGANNTITEIYDTRVYSTTTKTFANVTGASPCNSMLVRSNGTAGQFVPDTVATNRIYGVVVATSGGSTANTVNAIIATAGPVNVKAVSAPTNNQVDAYVIPSVTGGYANISTTPNATVYGNAGLSLNTISTACTINADTCHRTVFLTLNIK
jgi:hypothetical protein